MRARKETWWDEIKRTKENLNDIEDLDFARMLARRSAEWQENALKRTVYVG